MWEKMGLDETKIPLFGVGDIDYSPCESCNHPYTAESPTLPILVKHHKTYCSFERSQSMTVGSPSHWPGDESFRSLRRTSFPLGIIHKRSCPFSATTQYVLSTYMMVLPSCPTFQAITYTTYDWHFENYVNGSCCLKSGLPRSVKPTPK